MLEISNLTKSFGRHRVVDDLSLGVERGEVVGFLGPNGAGKSTTMRMSAGMIEPDSGDVLLNGHSILAHRLAAQRQLGYLPEGAPLYLDMTARAFLRFLAAARGLNASEQHNAIDRVASDCGIGEVLGRRLGTLSKGFRRRVALSGAILHDPPILILDEPTDGLDPNQKRAVRALLARLSQTKSILISTHALDEVEAMCTRAVVVHRGQIVARETIDGLKARAEGGDLETVFAELTGAHEAVLA